MSGNGGLFTAGRWHHQGARIVYCAESLALATLELFVNLQNKEILTQYVKSRISIPRIADLTLTSSSTTAMLHWNFNIANRNVVPLRGKNSIVTV